jgi:UDP-N-acetylglucosamine:LPS N-acetylglucosamine transferase
MQQQQQKKRVLVIYSNGGGGHVSAKNACQAALNADYEVHTVDPTASIPCEDMFNQFMKKGNFFAASLLVKMQYTAEWIAPLLASQRMIKNAINNIQPHLIISVIPLHNYYTLSYATSKNIPMFLVPTDITFMHFLYFIKNPPPSFKVLVPFGDLPDVATLINKHGFTKDNFVVTGYPLRSEFSAPAEEIEQQWKTISGELGVAPKDKVITVMMGAQGSAKHSIQYVTRILKDTARVCNAEFRVHLVVMCGENQTLRRQLEAISTISHLKIHALGRKDGGYVSALLHHTHAFCTKPGGSSVNEAMCAEVFTVFEDDSAKCIWWEHDNMMYSVNHGYGEVVDKRHFGAQLKRALRRTTRPSIENCPGRRFNLNLQNLVQTCM